MFRFSQVGTLLFGLLFLATLGSATLSVYNWQALGSSDSSLQTIPYSIANYGFAPFGKTIIGKLIHAPDFGPECTPVTQTGVNYQNSFLLMTRGECEFVTKTLNAQKLGAQMAIITDNKEHKGSVIMADNGYGYKVTIPSLFINFEMGEKLKQLLKNNPGSGQPDVMLKVTFDNQKTEKVDFTLFLQANNRHSYRFVQSFSKYYDIIKENVDLKLVYSTLKCADCPPTDCYNNQEYCAFNYIHGEGASGRLILDQQLREQLLFKLNPDKWWAYMQYVGDECAVISELQACQREALQSIGLDPEELQSSFKGSFVAGEENSVFNTDRQHVFLAGITRFPSVTLNRVKLRGNLQAQFVFDDICNTLESPPPECQKYVGDQTVFEREVSMQWSTLVLVVTGGLIVFSLVFCLYRRHMKRKISAQMQGRVDDMVSKYIQFYSERNK